MINDTDLAHKEDVSNNSVSPTDTVFYSIAIVLGVWTAITNGLLLLLFHFNPVLRKSKKHHLQYAFFVAEFVFGFGSMIVNADHLRVQYSNGWYTAYYCLATGSIPFFGDIFSMTIISFMALERLFATFRPLVYRVTNLKIFSTVCVTTALVFTLVCCGVGFYGIDNNVKPSACTATAARNNSLKPLHPYLKCALGCYIVLLYAILLIVLRIRIKAGSLGNDNGFEKEVNAFKTVSAVVVICFLFAIIPSVVSTILTGSGISAGQLGNIALVMSLSDSSVTIVIYCWRDRKIRESLRKLLKNNEIQNVNVSVPTGSSAPNWVGRSESRG